MLVITLLHIEHHITKIMIKSILKYGQKHTKFHIPRFILKIGKRHIPKYMQKFGLRTILKTMARHGLAYTIKIISNYTTKYIQKIGSKIMLKHMQVQSTMEDLLLVLKQLRMVKFGRKHIQLIIQKIGKRHMLNPTKVALMQHIPKTG